MSFTNIDLTNNVYDKIMSLEDEESRKKLFNEIIENSCRITAKCTLDACTDIVERNMYDPINALIEIKLLKG